MDIDAQMIDVQAILDNGELVSGLLIVDDEDLAMLQTLEDWVAFLDAMANAVEEQQLRDDPISLSADVDDYVYDYSPYAY